MDWMVVVSALAGVLVLGRYVYIWRRYACLHEGRFLEDVRVRLILCTFAAFCFEVFAFMRMKTIGGHLSWRHVYGGLAFVSLILLGLLAGNLLLWIGVETRPGVDLDG